LTLHRFEAKLILSIVAMCWFVRWGKSMSMFAIQPSPLLGFFTAAVLLMVSVVPTAAADRDFPYDSELILDVNPMKGSKRVPMLDIGARGEASIDLWCNTIKAQFVVASDTITIVTGEKTDRQCAPERMRGDDELLAVLLQVTNWRCDGALLTLHRPRTMRFRLGTH
jgi:heat shock protein HslJ